MTIWNKGKGKNKILNCSVSAMEHLIICEENRLRRQVETLRVEKSQIDELAQTIQNVKKQLGIE